MVADSTLDRYGWPAQFLHWLTVVLIIVQFTLAELAEDAAGPVAQLGLLARHKSVGITILALAVLRLGWRILVPPPPLPASMPVWQRRAAAATHGLLYGLLFVLPLTGWLMSSAKNYSVSWFGLIELPDLVGPDPALEHRLEEVHESLALLLALTALLHAAAALKHHFFDRDGVLRRMLSPWALVFTIVLLPLSLWAAVQGIPGLRAGSTAPEASAPEASAPEASAPEVVAPEASAPEVVVPEVVVPEVVAPEVPEAEVETGSPEMQTSESDVAGVEAAPAPDAPGSQSPLAEPVELPRWLIDPEWTRIRFVGIQAGARFEGEWTRFDADIRFDPGQLDSSRVRVVIDTASGDTGDSERDEIMRGPEWFDSERYPQALFVAERFEAVGDGRYAAHGELTIRAETRPVSLTFTFERDGSEVRIEGETTLSRTAFGLGQGDWADTTWIGDAVEVRVRVRAEVPDLPD